MRPILFFLLLGGVSAENPWPELSLSIEKDPGYSSDQVTVCRVRVTNNGSHTWPGRRLHFEARAIDGGLVVERVRGRFGLQLLAHGSLETLIGFSGVYVRFEVSPADSSPDTGARRKRSSGGKRSKRKPRRG